MNKLIKKVLVGITAATMMFGSVCTAYAATDSATVAPAPEKQTNVKADNGAKVSTAANGTATVKALPKTTKKSVTVASKVVVDGVSYKVTAMNNFLKNLGILLIVLGTAVLVLSYVCNWLDYNWPNGIALLAIVVGIIVHIVMNKIITR